MLFVCLIWVLTVYEFKLVSLNILIDFLQVMALCSSFNLNWGAAGDTAASPLLIRSAALFNFNFETFMPACVFPNWNYEGLWWFLMLLPPTFLLVIQLGSLVHLGCGSSGRIVRVLPDGTVRPWKGGKSKITPNGSSIANDLGIDSIIKARTKRIRARNKACLLYTSPSPRD